MCQLQRRFKEVETRPQLSTRVSRCFFWSTHVWWANVFEKATKPRPLCRLVSSTPQHRSAGSAFGRPLNGAGVALAAFFIFFVISSWACGPAGQPGTPTPSEHLVNWDNKNAQVAKVRLIDFSANWIKIGLASFISVLCYI